MIHPHTELRFVNSTIGYGVFATQFIPRGTITWVRDELDQTLSPAQFAAMPQIHHSQLFKYAYRDDLGNQFLCWDLGRFMNQSCGPSCLGYGLDFELAIRDIHEGEELTSDYATFNLLPHESFRCSCSSPQCRMSVAPGDVRRLADKWTDWVDNALQMMKDLPQPLWELMQQEYIDKACRKLSIAL